MTDEEYRRRLGHEALHGLGVVWIDGEGDEWIEVEPDGFVLHGQCNSGGVDPRGSRWASDEVIQNYYGCLEPAPSVDCFQIAELP